MEKSLFSIKTLLFSILFTLASIAGWGQTYTMNNDKVLPSGWSKTSRSAFQTYANQSQLQLLGASGGTEGEVYTTFTFTNVSGVSFNGTSNNGVTLTGLYSTDGSNWTNFGTVYIAKNTSSNSDYSFSDVSALSGKTVYLKFRASANSAYLKTITITTTATVDTTPPTVSSLSPADNDTNVAIDANLSMTFNENVKKGTGDIYILRSSDNAVIQWIDVASSYVSVSNATVTVNPPVDLANSTGYNIRVDSGAIQDTAGNNYAGITDATTWNFTTAALAAPVITSSLTKSTQYGTADTYEITAPGATTYSTDTLPAGFTFSGRILTKANNVNVGTYNISISATNAGGTDTKTLVWTVNKKDVTVTGLTASNKVYDGTTAATLSGTATLNGSVNGDAVGLSGTASGAFSDKNANSNITVNITGLALAGAQAGNYILTQPTATADITKASLTVSGLSANNKVYDGTDTATFNGGTPNGIIGTDVVTISSVAGTFDNATAGSAKTVTVSTVTLGGKDAGNYQVNPMPIGLTANITKATPVITATVINVGTGGTYPLPGAAISSTSSEGALSYTITNGGFATLSGTTITGNAVGTETLTISQAASANYNAATSVNVPVNVTTITYVNGDYRTTGTGNWVDNSATPAIWERYNGSEWAISNSPIKSTSNNIYIRNGHTITTGTSFANSVKIHVLDGGTFVSGHPSTANTVHIYSGGVFNFNAVLTISTSFEIEAGGTFNYNYSSNPGSGLNLWNGTEKFHPNSNFVVKSHATGGGNYFLPSTLSAYTENGITAYFGNLIFDASALDIRLTSSNLSSTSIYLTAGNLEIKPYSVGSGSQNLFYDGGTWIIGKNLIIDSNSISSVTPKNVVLKASTNIGNVTLNVKGNVINNSTNTLNLSNSTSGSFTLNVDGDLQVGTDGKLISAVSSNPAFNFSGIGNGSEDDLTQTINVVNTATLSNVNFNVNSGAYVKLINQDLALGTNSKFNVLSGGTLDFGFAADGTTALNILANGNGQTFTSVSGSNLKITSPEGITKTANLGNVQVPVAGRTYNGGATYHYIGKENQKSGDGLPDGLTNKLIVDLQTTDALNENLEFRADGIIKFNSDGTLEIRKGKVIDEPGKGFRNNVVENEDGESDLQKGNILMTGGRYVVSGSGTKPSLSGSYTLSDGTIQFAGIAATKIRTSSSPVKQYYNVDVSGTNVKSGGKNLIVNQVTKVTGTGKLTIPETDDDKDSYVLTAKKGIHVATGGTVLFENNAQLMQDVDASNSGNVKMERKTKMKKMDYIYWGTPVQGDATSGQILLNTTNPDLETSSGGFSPGTPNKRIYRYNEPNDYFVATTDAYFIPGKGYAIRGKHGNGDTKTADTFSFTGTPNNGDAITVSVQRSPNNAYNHGYNLIGNPYPSGLNFDEFATDNIASIKGTAWFWSNLEDNLYQSGSTNSTHNNYAVLTLAGGSPPTTGAGGLAEYTPTENIKVGQGFIVQVRDELASTSLETRTLVFKNDMRTTGAGVFFNNPKKLSPIKNRYWLRFVSPDNVVNTILLAHLTNATDGYDQDYDAELFTVGDDSFYSLLGTKKLQIQAKGEFVQDAKIDIATKQNQDGNYTIQLEQPEGAFANGQAVYLHDKLNGTYTNLLEKSYTFAATKGTDESRFEIVYKDGVVLGVGNASKSDFIVYRNGSDFVVKSSKILGKVEVYDTAGRLVFAQTTSNNILKLDTSRLPEGVFIIKAENSGDIKTKKILK
ncbi:YDG domain-containing protein [Epilithonimonas vandammei]|uniref:YDG domain-containing protein n=1 Tax=Epilithonimonas vandammei TaxID=2487072 RepID=UPI0028AC11CB|nr:YDG domain-containing protein [Epilithonimonas vandammei]